MGDSLTSIKKELAQCAKVRAQQGAIIQELQGQVSQLKERLQLKIGDQAESIDKGELNRLRSRDASFKTMAEQYADGLKQLKAYARALEKARRAAGTYENRNVRLQAENGQLKAKLKGIANGGPTSSAKSKVIGLKKRTKRRAW